MIYICLMYIRATQYFLGGVFQTFAWFTPRGGDTGTRTLDPLLAKQVL